jgi:hypothetical protein
MTQQDIMQDGTPYLFASGPVDNGYKLPINNPKKDWFKVENGRLKHVFELHTRGGFLWRLWFLLSAPIIWLVKGEVKIK